MANSAKRDPNNSVVDNREIAAALKERLDKKLKFYANPCALSGLGMFVLIEQVRRIENEACAQLASANTVLVEQIRQRLNTVDVWDYVTFP